MAVETMTVADEEQRLRELNKQDPFDLQPAVIKEKLTVLKWLLNAYRQMAQDDVSVLSLHNLQAANASLRDLCSSMHDQIEGLKVKLSHMVEPWVISDLEARLSASVSKDQYDQLAQLNHRLKDQVNDLMTAQRHLNDCLVTKTRQLETVSQQRDTLQKQLKQYQRVSEVVTRFPVRSVNGYTSFSDMWNDKINDPGWHIYLIGGYGVETHLPLVKIGRAKNMKDRFRLYDELEPGYLKDAGQSTFAGRFDLRPGYQFPLGLYRLTDLGIDGNDELYFRMEAVYKAILRSIFADNCLSGRDGRQLEFFRSDDKSLYEKMTDVFDQVSSLLTNAGADKVQAMLMQYSKDTLVKRLLVEEPVVVLQDWLASL